MSVTVTQYMVVLLGNAVGVEQVMQDNPADGDQLYVPPPVAVSVVLAPIMIVLGLAPAVAVGPGVCVTLTVCVCVQPIASTMVTV